MRSVDLALYADTLAARASAVVAQLERERDALRQAAIEREACRSLDQATVVRLERMGVLAAPDSRGTRAEIAELAADLGALEELQAWVEGRLFAERQERAVAAEELSAPPAKCPPGLGGCNEGSTPSRTPPTALLDEGAPCARAWPALRAPERRQHH